jgi:hypothetical protein
MHKSTHVISFFGTPHRGSDWVRLAKRMTIFALGRSDTKILDALRVDSKILQRLTDSFATILEDRDIKVRSFTENLGMSGIPGFTDKVYISISKCLSALT